MLYSLLSNADGLVFINLFRYISFRSGGAIFTAFLISLFIGPKIINILRQLNPKGQPIRKDGPQSHIKDKKGTPTMGGLIILISSLVSTLLWVDLGNSYIWIVLFVTISFALLGFVDDYLKVTKYSSRGVPGKVKLLIQTFVSIIACYAIQKFSLPEYYDTITLPFLKSFNLSIGWFYFVFVSVVIVGASNAVNLTDGLDGLAMGPSIIAFVCFAIISYITGNIIFSSYLQIIFVKGVGEITVFCAAMVGSCLGFLWFNSPPAKIFMGDVGSLSLGGALGTIAVITKNEFVLAIIGGVFVMEAISVILQVYYFKFSGGKRILLMAPLHHHFEKKGWSEATVVIRFWIMAALFGLIGIATLKLR
ncbi:MAG: phospho-N-acetylmuramoyl-pentapeptide-transferase [Rickettsiales bacterium]